jgi:hypothetical protein
VAQTLNIKGVLLAQFGALLFAGIASIPFGLTVRQEIGDASRLGPALATNTGYLLAALALALALALASSVVACWISAHYARGNEIANALAVGGASLVISAGLLVPPELHSYPLSYNTPAFALTLPAAYMGGLLRLKQRAILPLEAPAPQNVPAAGGAKAAPHGIGGWLLYEYRPVQDRVPTLHHSPATVPGWRLGGPDRAKLGCLSRTVGAIARLRDSREHGERRTGPGRTFDCAQEVAQRPTSCDRVFAFTAAMVAIDLFAAQFIPTIGERTIRRARRSWYASSPLSSGSPTFFCRSGSRRRLPDDAG